MKGITLIVNIILIVAVAVLYVLHFTGAKSGAAVSQGAHSNKKDSSSLKIAYVKADSVILNYDLAKVLDEEFTKMQEAYTNEYGSKRETFEKEAAAFQEKVQRGGFLTEERAIQERDRLVGKEQEIQKLDQELSTKLGNLQTTNNQQVLDSLLNYVKLLNDQKKYDYIFSGSNIIVGDEAHNLTSEVLHALNERYSGEE